MKKTKFLLKLFLSLFVLYGLVGFFILPSIIKEQLIINLEKLLTRKVNVESVSCNPYTFELTVHKLGILDKEGENAFAGVRKVDINSDPLYLIRGELKVKSIEVKSPFISVHKNKEGVYNFSDLLVKNENNSSKNEKIKMTAPAFILESLIIKSGKINFIDDTGSEPFDKSLKLMNLSLQDFSTLDSHDNKLTVSMELEDGARIDYKGKISSLKPLLSEGSIVLNSSKLYTYWEYFRDSLGFVVRDGVLNASMRYSANFSAEPIQININQYQFNVNDLRLQDKKTNVDVLVLPFLSLSGHADLRSKKIQFDDFLIGGLRFNALRNRDGAINWPSYFPASNPSPETNETSPWTVNIAKVDIKTDELLFEEHYCAEPYVAGLKNISLNIKDIKLVRDEFYIGEFETRLSEFSLRPLSQEEEYASFNSLNIEGSLGKKISTDIHVSHIDLDELNISAYIDKAGVLNFSKLSAFSGKDEKTGQGEKEKSLLNWEVKKLQLSKANLTFTDLSLPLAFTTDIHDINGQMSPLGNLVNIKTRVEIDGIVDEYGLVKINGELLSAEPMKYSDMEVKLKNIDMIRLSPYSSKFIGYKLKEGKMNVALGYKVKASQMQGENRIIVNQLTLGETVNSTDAISAPVSLALALLKDSEGVIDLDVPVRGDVDKPDFAIGKAVWKALKNVITSVANAPFESLGKILGISADELKNIEFEAGKTNLLPSEREKLDKLVGVFSSRDTLRLKVAGSYDIVHDTLAIQTAEMFEKVLMRLNDHTVTISQMEKGDLDDLLKEMYLERFGKENFLILKEKIRAKYIDIEKRKSELRKIMRDGLVDEQTVSQEDLLELANMRVKTIITYAISKGINADRLELLDPVEVETEQGEKEYIPTKLQLGAR